MNSFEKSKPALGMLINRIRGILSKWKERKEISSTEKIAVNNYHNKFTNTMIRNMEKQQNEVIINKLVLKWIIKRNRFGYQRHAAFKIKDINNTWTNNMQTQRIQIGINQIKMKNHRKFKIGFNWMPQHQNSFLARMKESNTKTKTIIIINMHKMSKCNMKDTKSISNCAWKPSVLIS